MSLPFCFDFPGQLKNWLRVQRVSPSFIVLGQVSAAGFSESSEIFFILMRRVSPLLFHQSAKVCILESHLRRRRCVG